MFIHPLLWITDFLINAGFAVLGVLLVRSLLPGTRLSEQIALGYGLAIGVLTWILFILSWAGIPINPFTIVITWLILVAICLGYMKMAKDALLAEEHPHIREPGNTLNLYESIGWVILTIFGVLLFFMSIGVSYTGWDSMAIWSIKGYGIGLDHSVLGAADQGSKGLAYPLNIPIAISIFFTINQDVLPGSKLIFPSFYLALLIGMREYLRKQEMPVWLSWCIVFSIGTIPILLQHSLIGYANIPYAFYYVLGILWIGLGLKSKSPRHLFTGALMLALSIWTRLEGLQFWFIAVAGLLVVWRRDLLERRRLLFLILPALVIGGSWVTFGRINQATTGELAILSYSLERIFHGEINLKAIYQIARFTGYLVVKTRVFGVVVPVVIGLALPLVIFSKNVRQNKLVMTTLSAGSFTGLGVAFMYYLTSYDQKLSLEQWLGTGYERMLFSTIILLALASASILWKIFGPKDA